MPTKSSNTKTTAKKTTRKKAPAKAPARRNVVSRSFDTAPKLSKLTLLIVVILFGAIGTYLLIQSHADSCTVSSTLVNSCRPWLGANTGGYKEVPAGVRNQTGYTEQQIGRQLDVVHDYRAAGSNKLTADDTYYATRANTTLMLNWKPANNWKSAAGGNASVNAGIDSMAKSIKSLGSHKIMLAVFHEPENDVSPGGSPSCGNSITYKGNAGTTADYVAMWHNVRNRFNAAGVNNVVWVMNYMGFENWNCMTKDLWPGNSYVDWLVWDPYVSGNNTTFTASVSNFYNHLTTTSDSSHDYLSKTWGLNEWESQPGVSQQNVYAMYDNAKAALDANTFPKLKLYDVFNTINGPNFETGYTAGGVKDPTEQAHFNAFANDPRFTNAYYYQNPIKKDTTPPTISISNLANNATRTGSFTITGTAHDNVGVTSVSLRIDNKFVDGDAAAPYSFTINTATYGAGKHTIVLRAWDAANNSTDATANVTFGTAAKK